VQIYLRIVWMHQRSISHQESRGPLVFRRSDGLRRNCGDAASSVRSEQPPNGG
jgi:hypothetical protein